MVIVNSTRYWTHFRMIDFFTKIDWLDAYCARPIHVYMIGIGNT